LTKELLERKANRNPAKISGKALLAQAKAVEANGKDALVYAERYLVNGCLPSGHSSLDYATYLIKCNKPTEKKTEPEPDQSWRGHIAFMLWGPIPVSGDPSDISSKFVRCASRDASDNIGRKKLREKQLNEKVAIKVRRVEAAKIGQPESKAKLIQVLTLGSVNTKRDIFKFHQVLESEVENELWAYREMKEIAVRTNNWTEANDQFRLYMTAKQNLKMYTDAMKAGDMAALESMGLKHPDDPFIRQLIEQEKKIVHFDLTGADDDGDDDESGAKVPASSNTGNELFVNQKEMSADTADTEVEGATISFSSDNSVALAETERQIPESHQFSLAANSIGTPAGIDQIP
jgi:hypothetical protein